jgi:hypothetical protein
MAAQTSEAKRNKKERALHSRRRRKGKKMVSCRGYIGGKVLVWRDEGKGSLQYEKENLMIPRLFDESLA